MSSSGSTPPNMGTDSKANSARRPSSNGVAFAGLVNQKRNSTDAAAAARRASFHDAKPQAGFLGQMWHNWTHGPAAASK